MRHPKSPERTRRTPALARLLAATVLLVSGASTVAAQTTALDAAAAAMGGKDRVLGVRTLVMEGAGETLNFGQNHTPTAETKFEVTSFRRAFDFANRRWFHDQTRVPRFPTANSNPQRMRYGVDASADPVAYNVLPSDSVARASAAVASDRATEFAMHPLGFLLAAYAPGTETAEESAGADQRRVRIRTAGQTYAMVIDMRTNLPVRIERQVDQPMLGDVTMIADLADWREADGLKLPMRVTQRYENLFVLADLRLSGARVNADVGDLAATDAVRASVVQAGAPPTIVVDTIAPGVWWIGGQSHHTIAIEQANQVVLVEAPQNDARTLAAIERARELRPAKPVTLLINTHHHFDHSGGVRAAIAQGLTIVTHESNRDFYERMVFRRPHLIAPDALAKNPKPLRLVPVRDRYTRADSARPIEVYHVPSDHAGTMLVVYLPSERILIQADLYNPPAPTAVNPVFPFAKALVENVQRRGLAVDRVVGIHGRPVSWNDVVQAAQ